MHESSIIHRDIKPKNIFIMENNRIVIGDFWQVTEATVGEYGLHEKFP